MNILDHIFYCCNTEFEDSGSDSSSDMDEYGWEEDEEGKTSKHAKIKRPPSLDKYMDIMDRELSKTDVGKSFEKQKKKTEKVLLWIYML